MKAVGSAFERGCGCPLIRSVARAPYAGRGFATTYDRPLRGDTPRSGASRDHVVDDPFAVQIVERLGLFGLPASTVVSMN